MILAQSACGILDPHSGLVMIVPRAALLGRSERGLDIMAYSACNEIFPLRKVLDQIEVKE